MHGSRLANMNELQEDMRRQQSLSSMTHLSLTRRSSNQSFAPRLSKDREGGDSPPQPCIAIALQLGGLDTLIYSVFSYFLGVQVLHCFLSLLDYCLLVLHCCCQYLGGFWVLLLLLLR
ncbi:hypothetical protein OIU78_012941 [Salix suchowensis]|nr:hypothetical protein OIU78_012941 [Salix suchowensis]